MFDVLFKGECQPQQDVETVKQNMARLFKIPVEKAEGLFSGQTLTLKRGLDKETASKYIKAIASAGAIAYVVESPDAPRPADAAPAAAEPADDTGPSDTAEPAETAQPAPAAEPVSSEQAPASAVASGQGSILDAKVDPPGTTILEHEVIPEPDIDTGHMTLSEPGTVLVEAEKVPDADIDTGNMSLSELGSNHKDQ